MRKRQGITLIELVVAIGIVTILATIAIPSFTHLRHDSERVSAVNGFLHGLFLARSESMRRGQIVTLCKSRDGVSCSTTGEWEQGWMIFVNVDQDDPPQRDADEDVLLVNQGWKSGTITSNRPEYSMRPYQQSAVNGTLLFCDPRGSEEARAIIISFTGRARVSRRDSSNRPLRCLR